MLPRDYADKARATGLDITVSGKDRSFPVAVPAEALAHFLDSYAQAASSLSKFQSCQMGYFFYGFFIYGHVRPVFL